MHRRSPTLEGFRAMVLHPSLGLAEIAWRWSFGGGMVVLCATAFLEYLNTLPVSRSDLLLLRTRHPVLISRALANIFRGSGSRAVEAMAILFLTLAAGWIAIASLGRLVTVQSLLDHFRRQVQSNLRADEKSPRKWRLRSLLALNLLRALLALAATVGLFGAFFLGGSASPAENPAPGAAFLIVLTLASLVWLVWSTLNWFLSLAAVFLIRDGQNVRGSLEAVVDFCHSHVGSVIAAGTWFGLAHIAAFFVATTVVAFPLAMVGFFPGGVVLGGILLVALLYFALVDFLYVGRLAAYVAMLELPELSTTEPENLLPSRPPTFRFSRDPVDPDELILSDLPGNP
jgi:hypothetical protein